MRTVGTLLLLILAGVAALSAAAAAAEQVDLLLVLAADVSRSVDSAKFQLQREVMPPPSPIPAYSMPFDQGVTAASD